MIPKLDVETYVRTMGLYSQWKADDGGQMLLLADIIACFSDCKTIAVPYPCPIFEDHLRLVGKRVVNGMDEAEGAYWGTPTVVDNKALFPKCLALDDSPNRWTKQHERAVSRNFAVMARRTGVRVIVTGLGTGDISVEERLEDMGGGKVVSYKDFGDFEDRVLCRCMNDGDLD